MSQYSQEPQILWAQAVESLQQLWLSMRKWLPIVVIIIVGLWLALGIYTVGPGEVGVVRMFGREINQTAPGGRVVTRLLMFEAVRTASNTRPTAKTW